MFLTPIKNNIDPYNNLKTQIGEKCHLEYAWSNNIYEKIIQLNFQLVRTNNMNINLIQNIYKNLLIEVKKRIDLSFHDYEAKHILILLYKLIIYTRDIIDGKGEYYISYVLLYEFYETINKELAIFVLHYFVYNINNDHPLGSWKDIKYLCNYVNNIDPNSPLIASCIQLINNQLKIDYNIFLNNINVECKQNITLLCKWIPREKSKFGWLYEKLACHYFSKYINNRNQKAILKCKTEYRKIISQLNKYIETTEIKMCSNEWKSIDFMKVPTMTLFKQKKAFLNENKNNDRKICSENFKNHILNAKENMIQLKSDHLDIINFSKYAIELLKDKNYLVNKKIELDLLNLLWNNNSQQNDQLSKMIAIVDLSDSMKGDPKYAALSLGIRIAEKSILGKKLATFSSNPSWINLEDCNNFVSCIKKINEYQHGTNANIYSILDLILESIIENKLTSEEVQDMVIVILSDMQIDKIDIHNKYTLYQSIKLKYKEAGLKINLKPYKIPHIIFWNLRYTNGFPCRFDDLNTTMVSGYNPTILNIFNEKDITSYYATTPYYIFEKLLNNSRYKIFENKINEIYS